MKTDETKIHESLHTPNPHVGDPGVKHRSRMTIGPKTYRIWFLFPWTQPNCWFRFWQWLLLGWRWERIEE